MIRIKLTKREQLLLETGYFGRLSDGRNPKNRVTLKQLMNDTTSSTTKLLSRRNELGLERVKRKYKSCHKIYKKKCKYIASKDFPMEDELFIRESLVINPIYIVHTPYNKIENGIWKKIKSIVNLIELYNLGLTFDNELLDWLKVEDHYDSIKEMLGTLDADMANSYMDCEGVIAGKGVTWIDKLNDELKCIRDFIDEVYNYKAFFDRQTHYEISCLMKISVCPYCNRQYITILNNSQKGTATFDHFYREAIYPIFKLSLYNLVPSCYACNSVLKGTADKEHLNPWFMEKEEVEFDVVLNKDEEHYLKSFYFGYGNLGYTESKIEVKNARTGDINTDNSIDVFALKDVYEVHAQYAAKFAVKARKYERGKYKEMLIEKLSNAGFLVDEEMVDRMMYGFPSKVIGTDAESEYAMSMPLYKLKRDLVKKNKGI